MLHSLVSWLTESYNNRDWLLPCYLLHTIFCLRLLCLLIKLIITGCESCYKYINKASQGNRHICELLAEVEYLEPGWIRMSRMNTEWQVLPSISTKHVVDSYESQKVKVKLTWGSVTNQWVQCTYLAWHQSKSLKYKNRPWIPVAVWIARYENRAFSKSVMIIVWLTVTLSMCKYKYYGHNAEAFSMSNFSLT